MLVEAVTVCVGYADFLAEVAPFNAPHFRRWLVVTEPDDGRTREVCRRFNLDVLLCGEGTRGGDFAKGRMIERGLRHLRADGWRLHLDADVALPARFGALLSASDPDPECLHGCDRVMVQGYDRWRELVQSGWLQAGHWDYHCRLSAPPGLPLGTRWVDAAAGYCPIGFFQLWHSSADTWRGVRARPYPAEHNDACRTDVQFAQLWDRRQRRLIPELFVAHIESEPAPTGANWKGRKTKPFGPAPGAALTPAVVS